MPAATARKPAAARKPAGIGDAAVKKATGKIWSEWFALLAKAGAPDMTHKQISEYLSESCGVPPWWSQMVTVGYEQGVLGRAKHEKGGQYEVSVSRTIAAPVAAAYRAFTDARTRARWLPEEVEVRKATPGKSVRLTWEPSKGDKSTLVSVNLWSKGPQKCQVVPQHGKLPTQAAAARAKKLWAARLDALQQLLEKT